MSDTFPTLGLAFDLEEIEAGQSRLAALKQTYIEVGDAAADAAAKSASANASLRSSASVESPLTGRAAASSSAADAEKAVLAQMVSETQAALSAMNDLWAKASAQQGAVAQTAAKAATAATAQRVEAETAIVAQGAEAQGAAAVMAALQAAEAAQSIEAATFGRVTAEQAAEALLATYRAEMNVQQVRSAEAAEAEMVRAAEQGAAAKAAVAQESAANILAASREAAVIARAQYAEETAIAKAAAAEQLAAAKEAAAAAALAQREADAEAASSLRVRMAMTAQMFGEMSAEAQAAAVADMAAQKEAAASAQQSLALRMAMTRQMFAEMASEQAAVDAIANQKSGFLDSLAQQANAIGKSKSALLEEKAALLGVTEQAAPFISKIAESEHALNNLGSGGLFSARAIRELVVIMRELSRGDFSRLAGSATVELQALGALGPIIAAIPFIAVAAAATTFAVALDRGAAEVGKLNNALTLTGQYAGLTASQIDQLAQSTAHMADASVGQAEKAFLVATESGKAYGDGLKYVGQAAIEMGALTGQAADKLAAEYVRMFDNPVEGMKKLDDQYHFLTVSQYAHIEALANEGEKQQAATELFKDMVDWTSKQTKEMGYLDSALHNVAVGFGNVWEAIKNIGKEDPAAKLTQLKNELAEAQRAGRWDDITSGETGFTIPGIRTLQAEVSQQEGKVNNSAQAASTQQTEAEKQAFDGLSDAMKKAKSDRELLTEAIAKYDQQIQIDLHSNDPAAIAKGNEALKERNNVIAALTKEYDKADNPTTKKSQDPTLELKKQSDAIKELMAQINSITKDDDVEGIANKMVKASQDALGSANFAGGAKAAAAAQLAYNAAVKEGASDVEKKMATDQKDIDKSKEKLNTIKGEIDAILQQGEIERDYYEGNDHSIEAYSAMLQKQAAASLAAKNAADDLNIAQNYGVTSINQISKALQDELETGGMNETMAKKLGDAAQEEAQKRADVTHQVNAQTEAEKQLAAVQKEENSLKETIANQQDLAKAYLSGTDALIAYNRQLAIKQTLDKSPGMSVQDATQLVDQDQASKAQASEAKITYDLQQQLRLSQESSAIRVTAARAEQLAQDLIVEAQAKGITMTHQEALAQATVTAQIEQQLQDAAKLKTTIEDSIRQGFIDSGKLDFTSFKNAIEQSIRKAVYDSLLAKPIDMIVNATVNSVTSALQQAFGGAGSSGAVGSLFNIFGSPGSSNAAGNAFLGDWSKTTTDQTTTLSGGLSALGSTAKTANGLLGNINTSLGGLPAQIGSVLGSAVIGDTLGSAIASATGLKQNSTGAAVGSLTGAAIGSVIPGVGTAIGAILGDLVGGLFGGGPSNFAAMADVDAQGNVTSIFGDKPDATTTNAITSVANTIQPLIQQLAGLGIDAAGIVKEVEIGQRDPSRVFLDNGTVVRSATGDTAALGDAIEKAMLQNAKFSDPQMQTLVQSMLANNDSMTQINNTLSEYQKAQSLTSSLGTDALQYSNPQAYQLATLQASQVARREQVEQYASEGVITATQLQAINAQLDTLEKAEIGNVISNFATTVNGATTSLADLTDAQTKLATFVSGLTTGSLSPLSPGAQLTAAQTAYQNELTAAQGGDLASLQDISNTAQTYLTAAQKYYGSSAGYGNIFSAVSGQLTALSGQTFADPNAAATASAVASLQSALKAAGITVDTSSTSTTSAAGSSTPSVSLTGTTATALLTSIANGITTLTSAVTAGAATTAATTAASAATVAGATASAVTASTALSGGLLTRATSSIPVRANA